jgi:hypothetical protein
VDDNNKRANTQEVILININMNINKFCETSIVIAANKINGNAIRYLLKICLTGIEDITINEITIINARIREIESLRSAIKTTKTRIPIILARGSKL